MGGTDDREEGPMAYRDFPDDYAGRLERKQFWLSDEGLALIAGWRREGVSMEQIALRHIGIGDNTFRKWRVESEDLERVLKQGKDWCNAAVEESLLRRALGYDSVEVDEELVEGEMRVVRRRTRHVPADVKACLSWLFSQRSDRWRAQQEPLDATGEQIKAVKEVVVTIAEACRGGDLPEPEGDPSREEV